MRTRILPQRIPLFSVLAIAAMAVMILASVRPVSAAMSVTTISPNSGPLAGETLVTITGAEFPTDTADIDVTFGGANAKVQTANAAGTQITVLTPTMASPGAVDVVVMKPGQTVTIQDGFTYIGAPVVAGVAPSPSPAGSVVTIYGVNFAEGATVKFGAASGTEVDVLSENQIKVKVPNGTGTVDVIVTNPDAQADTADDAFTYGQGQGQGAPGTIISGSIPIGGGFGLIVFGGGTNQQLLTASGCPQATATFYATNAQGGFVTYIPGSGVQAVNATWNALFNNGIPATTALIGKCV